MFMNLWLHIWMRDLWPRNWKIKNNLCETQKCHACKTYIIHQETESSGKLRSIFEWVKDCDFKTVSFEQYKTEMIRDAFINGLQSNQIHQRLLEIKLLTYYPEIFDTHLNDL